MPTRRSLLLFVAGAGLLAVSGCTALSATGEEAALSIPTPTATPGPTVTGASVSAGSLTAETPVTLTGSGLAGVTSVLLGSVAVASVASSDGSSLTFTAPAVADYQSADVTLSLRKADGTVVSTGTTFSYQALTPVDAQLQYAFTYWQNYNLDEWGQFPDNDCGNFVAQTLLARGWTQNDDWYSNYATTGDYSYSWIRGTPMDEYLASRPDTTRLELSDRAKVKVGDVVMFDWDPADDNGPDHTMVVSKTISNADGTTSIKLTGHTVDAQYRDLDEAITVDNPGGTAHFYSITD